MQHAIPLGLLIDPNFISSIIGTADIGWLYRIGVTDYDVTSTSEGQVLSLSVVPLNEESRAGLTLIALPGFAFILGPWTDDSITMEVTLSENAITISVTTPLSLSLRPPLFHSVDPSTLKVIPDSTEGITVALGKPEIGIQLIIESSGDISANLNFDFHGEEISISEPFMVGETGVVLEVAGLEFNFSGGGSRPVGAPSDWKGIYIDNAKVHLPDLMDGFVNASALGIGAGGLYGNVSYKATAPLVYNQTLMQFTGVGNFIGDVLGIHGGISNIELAFIQSVPTKAEIKGKILFPFFNEPVDIEIGIGLNGSFTVKLDNENGLYKLSKPDIIEIELDRLGFQVEPGKLTVKLGGKITPLFAKEDIDWPAFDIKELSIDSNGNVHLDGGWIDLPKKYSVDFYGFNFEITKVGFGMTEDGGKYVGFSGTLKLVDELPAGASVEGLRIIWYDDGSSPRITFNGVGVEFKIQSKGADGEQEDIISFKGAVAYQELKQGVEIIHRFDGAIKLRIEKLKIDVDSNLVIGFASSPAGNYTFLAIYVAAELAKGIPLFGTGLGIYGMAGLFGLNVEPKKLAGEEWFEGWYKRPAIGTTDLNSKWINKNGSLALGAGVTIGTLDDNGFKFSGKVLLAVVFPGPIVLLEGKANILKKRAALGDDPIFRALAVLDNREGTFLIGLDAHYTFDESGALIDIRGSAEAFFNLNDASQWHLYLGQDEPRDKRIRARVYNGLFQPAAYFMLNARDLRMGIWYGYEKNWRFSRLSVSLEAWIEANVHVSWSPNQFQGVLSLHGKAQLKAFGRGLGLNVDAGITADVFTPYHLLGKFKVGIRLPWPINGISKNISLEWGGTKTPPELPDPLQEIAIDHFKVTTSWGLDKSSSSLSDPPPDNLAEIPVVPLDARPHLTFKRSMNDVAFVGVNPQQGQWEAIGDPTTQGVARARYDLTGVALHKWNPSTSSWVPVARKGRLLPPNETDPDDLIPASQLYASWAPLPAEREADGEKVSQTKLWVWSKNPFDYTRHTDRSWDEWFTRHFKHYPCLTPQPDRVICCDFQDIAVGEQLRSPWQCPDEPSLILSWLAPANQSVSVLDPRYSPTNGHGYHSTSQSLSVLDRPIAGLTHALCFPGRISDSRTNNRNRVTISLLEPAKSVDILAVRRPIAEEMVCFSFNVPGTHNGPNPRFENVPGFEQGLKIEVRNINGSLAARTMVVLRETPLGNSLALECDYETEITLPCVCLFVDILISFTGPTLTITALDEEGVIVVVLFPQIRPEHSQFELYPFRLCGTGAIKRVIIRTDGGATHLHEICFQCSGNARLAATGFDINGKAFGPRSTSGVKLRVVGKDLTAVRLESEDEFCLLQICASIGAAADEAAEREAMARHLQDETARWSQLADVFDPNTIYRIAVATTVQAESSQVTFEGFPRHIIEFAYFRTDEPPGLARLSLPADTSNPEESALRNKNGKFITVDNFGQIGEIDNLSQLNEEDKKARGVRAILKSELNDLTPYVHQTIPPTVTKTGDQPLPRPVYCAYDVGVEFNEHYVELLYRKAQRDLGLYLFDNNNQPVRDAQGRLIILNSRWRVTKNPPFDESERKWISLLEERKCASIDPTSIPRDNKLTSEAQGQVLSADSVYEARLVPLLMHEDFSSGISGWQIIGDASNWSIHGHGEIRGNRATVSGQTITLDGSPDLSLLNLELDVVVLDDDSTTPPRPYRIQSYNNSSPPFTVTVDGVPILTGESTSWRIPPTAAVTETSGTQTTLLGGNPGWVDYRFTVFARSSTDNSLGVVFRRTTVGDHYSFIIVPAQKKVQFYKVIGLSSQLLQESALVFNRDRDYAITVEAVGSNLRIYIDGALISSVTDKDITSGQVGLYSGGEIAGAIDSGLQLIPVVQFSDVRVDDFSADAPIVYSFKFITSRYANFFHHAHSYQDETWPLEAALQATAATSLPSTPISQEEDRAFKEQMSQVTATPQDVVAVIQNPSEVQVTRLEKNNMSTAFLIQSLEPLDWKRISLLLKRTAQQRLPLHAPVTIKLTDVSFSSLPQQESITLLAREVIDLSGHRIEYNSITTPIDESAWRIYYTFGSEARVAAGTRVRICSGNQTQAPPSEFGLIQRFIADGSNQGEVKFSSSGVTLRVIGPSGVNGHARAFMPQSAYTDTGLENLRILRKADGTAFFLMLANASPLAAGDYRLLITYSRDLGGLDPDKPVLSEAGNSNPESVTLDIPWQTNKHP